MSKLQRMMVGDKEGVISLRTYRASLTILLLTFGGRGRRE